MPRTDQRGRDDLWVRLRLRVVLGIGRNLAAGSALSALLLLAAERRAIDALLVVGAITYSVRHAIHLHLGYHRQRGTHGRRLAGLTRADAVIAAGFNVGVATCLCAELSGWAVAAFAASIFLSVILVSGATIVVTRDLHIQRGSEWIRDTPTFTWLTTSLDPHSDLFGKPLLWLMRKTTPVRDASCYIVCLLAILLVVATVESATAIKSIRDAMRLPGARQGPVEPCQSSTTLRRSAESAFGPRGQTTPTSKISLFLSASVPDATSVKPVKRSRTSRFGMADNADFSRHQ